MAPDSALPLADAAALPHLARLSVQEPDFSCVHGRRAASPRTLATPRALSSLKMSSPNPDGSNRPPAQAPRSRSSSLYTNPVVHDPQNEHVLYDPFRAPSVVLYIRACVIWDIWPSILCITAWTALIVALDLNVEDLHLAVSPNLLTVMGTVIGFIISYRTSSAYERYTEGRRMWSNITLAVRTLARITWIHVPNQLRKHTPDDPITDEEVVQALIQKKSTINLLEGFAIAMKHYLRGEHGIFYEDLYHLVCYLPKYTMPSVIPVPGEGIDIGRSHGPYKQELTESVEQLDYNASSTNSRPSVSRKPSAIELLRDQSYTGSSVRPLHDPLRPAQPLLPAYLPPEKDIYDHIPALTLIRSLWKGTRNLAGARRRKNRWERIVADDNIPLEIIIYLDSYWARLTARDLPAPVMTGIMNSMMTLNDTLSSLERILTTPLPFGYSVHLKLVIYVYLLLLPFQLLSSFGYKTIPGVALVSFAFIGFLHIGEEIENPFGYDRNDLDTDHICRNVIGRELAELTSWPAPDPSEYMHTSANLPLLNSGVAQSAADVARSGMSPLSLQRALRQRHNRSHPQPPVC